jgi:hypothetical protein
MGYALFRFGLGLVGSLWWTYLIVAFEQPDDVLTGHVAVLCMYALLALSGAYGLVLRRRSAKSTVYATENGVHGPQDTGNDQ